MPVEAETKETKAVPKARMASPVMVLPGTLGALLAFHKAIEKSSASQKTLAMVTLRASQINGCSVCVDMHSRELKKLGESDERLFTLAAWRDTPYFTDAERAALALAEALTRIADRPDAVTDEIWNEAAKHYNEKQLAALVAAIGLINVFNRLNVAVRQITGPWVQSAGAR